MAVETLERPKRDDTKKRNYQLKHMWITLAQRDTPGTYPPLGILSIMTYLKRHGYGGNMHLYNMDLVRPTREEALDKIIECAPEVLLISAPASTCYENSKYFSIEVRKRLPNVFIILGGNLAASAEIIVRKTEVDMCILGEGEYSCLEVFDQLAEDFNNRDFRQIKGVAYLNKNGNFVSTGYADQLPKDKIFEVEWEILDEGSVKQCMPQLRGYGEIQHIMKYYYPEGVSADNPALDKNVGLLPLSKGCVARCTFCHRFIKGIRFVPPDLCIERIEELMNKFNCGVFTFVDECFGADIKWLKEFCEKVKPLNIRWSAGGVRVQHITPEVIRMMKDAGCSAVIYGMETGSDHILKIMEKRASLQDNINAFKWTLEAGLYTTPQLILGMPGETFKTVEESAEFISHFLTINKEQNPAECSINFAQALPGTPLYEYARNRGLIGDSIEAEEQYLLDISDRNASDEETTLDLTGFPKLILVSWRDVVRVTNNYRYCQKFGYEHYIKMTLDLDKKPNFWKMLFRKEFNNIFMAYPQFCYKTRRFLWFYSFISIVVKKKQVKRGFKELGEVIRFYLKGGEKSIPKMESESLRKKVNREFGGAHNPTPETVELRIGR